jgi:hypothetical protein
VTELGSVRGTCSTPPPPPPPSGAAGSGGAGGAGGSGGSSSEAGSGGSGGTSSEPPVPCAVYGQQCGGNSDCCSNVPCTDGFCSYPLL